MTIINNFWKLLENKQKVLFLTIIFFSLIQAILEMIGIAAAIPFVTFLLKPESIAEIDIISKYIVKKEKEARSLLFRLKRAELSTLKRQSPEEQKKTISAAHDTYPSIIALGIKSFDDMIMIEKELASKRQEADQLKSAQLEEMRILNKVLEVLM